MKKGILAAAIAATMVAAPAMAKDISYTYIEGNYLKLDVDGDKADGFVLAGSASLNDNVFLRVSAGKVETQDELTIGPFSDKIEVTERMIGLGFHGPLSETVDGVFTLSFYDQEAEFADFEVDSDGELIQAGVRSQFANGSGEFSISLDHARGEFDNETGMSVGLRGYLNEALSVAFGYSTLDDTDGIKLSLRAEF
jgi:hypothetical protein